jgi:alpha-galactosidase
VGIDYLKYDWYPNDVPSVRTMSQALRASGRDIVFSLSNRAPFADAAAFAQLAECWRTTGDIYDSWGATTATANGWTASPRSILSGRVGAVRGARTLERSRHVVVGMVGWSANLHPTRLTPDEQIAHISLWCLLSAPLLIGCDLERLDAFTAPPVADQRRGARARSDALGRQAVRVGTMDRSTCTRKIWRTEVWRSASSTAARRSRRPPTTNSGASGSRQGARPRPLASDGSADAGGFISVTVPPHGVFLVKLAAAQ